MGARVRALAAKKGGKQHKVPVNHNLDEHLVAYIKGAVTVWHKKRSLLYTSDGECNH